MHGTMEQLLILYFTQLIDLLRKTHGNEKAVRKVDNLVDPPLDISSSQTSGPGIS